MTSPNSSGALGNVLTRLGGLKNVSGRRVMPGSEVLEELNVPEPDVSGTSQDLPNFSNFTPPPMPNSPEPDLGGHITPQSYDVRANIANPPSEEPQQEAGFWNNIGRSLAQYLPKMKSEQDIINPPQETQVKSSPLDYIPTDYLPKLKPSVSEIPQTSTESSGKPNVMDYLNKPFRDPYVPSLQPQPEPSPEQIEQQSQEYSQSIQKAMESPWKYSAFGSADQVANSPALQAEFKTLTGIDYEPQIKEQISEYESAMKGVEDALNGINTNLDETGEGIKQRILNNQSTDADKYFIGLALLMPLLVGGLFGKEAGLGALSGGAKGYADVLNRRQENIVQDEEGLLDINREKSKNQEKLGNMQLEKAKLGPALRKLLPEQPNSHLIGQRAIEYVDPATGEKKSAVEIKPGLVARSEFVSTPEGQKDMLKSANELSAVKSYVDQLNDLTDDVTEIVSQLKPGNDFGKVFTSILSKASPQSIPKITQDVMFQGRKVNAGLLLQEKLGFLANMYAKAQGLGQLDKAAQVHMDKLINNPTISLISPQDSINQMIEIRNLSQNGLVNEAANRGFLPEFVIQGMEKGNQKFQGKINSKEEARQLEELKRDLIQNEMKYGQ